MLTKLLFGVQHSPFRALCVGLAVLIVILGIVGIPMVGWQSVPFLIIGLLAVAVLSRGLTAYDYKQATTRQLQSIGSTEVDEEALRRMVDHTPHDPNPKVTTASQDRDELRALIEQSRRDGRR